MARASDITANDEAANRLWVHRGIAGHAEIVVSTTVQFESVEVMDAFCDWIVAAGNSVMRSTVVDDFIAAAENARDEAERIRKSLNGRR